MKTSPIVIAKIFRTNKGRSKNLRLHSSSQLDGSVVAQRSPENATIDTTKRGQCFLSFPSDKTKHIMRRFSPFRARVLSLKMAHAADPC